MARKKDPGTAPDSALAGRHGQLLSGRHLADLHDLLGQIIEQIKEERDKGGSEALKRLLLLAKSLEHLAGAACEDPASIKEEALRLAERAVQEALRDKASSASPAPRRGRGKGRAAGAAPAFSDDGPFGEGNEETALSPTEILEKIKTLYREGC